MVEGLGFPFVVIVAKVMFGGPCVVGAWPPGRDIARLKGEWLPSPQ